jgi:hypothetical protein
MPNLFLSYASGKIYPLTGSLIRKCSYLNTIVDRLRPLGSKTRGPIVVHAERDAGLINVS